MFLEPLKGPLLKLNNKNIVHFEYSKNEADNFASVQIYGDLSNGLLQASLRDDQLYFLSKFLDGLSMFFLILVGVFSNAFFS